jgi:hypothetical protein
MKTALDWLEENIERDMDFLEILFLIKHAKEMEKEQIMDACKQCSYSYEEAEQYYNETFKTK